MSNTICIHIQTECQFKKIKYFLATDKLYIALTEYSHHFLGLQGINKIYVPNYIENMQVIMYITNTHMTACLRNERKELDLAVLP